MDALQHLKSFALKHSIFPAASARGLCFHASLDMAAEAQRIGFEDQTKFVRWRVRHDTQFLEHWAVCVSQGVVLDLTAVQVDGNPNPVRMIAEYPINYGTPRMYPIGDILLITTAHHSPLDDQHTRRNLFRVHVSLFKHDMSDAIRSRSIISSMQSIWRLAEESVMLVLCQMLELAIKRLTKLLYEIR